MATGKSLGSSMELLSNSLIYILPNSLSKNYVHDLKNASIKNGFTIVEKFE